MKIFLITLAAIFNITICLSQTDNTTTGRIGIIYKTSSDKQYLTITSCTAGYSADIYGLKVGDRIYKIDDKNVSEIANPGSQITGTSGTYVKLTINRFGYADYFNVNVPRITIDDNSVPEGKLAALIHTDDHTDCSRMEQSSMAVLDDDEKDMFKYKTYDYEYTSADDPLLEKEIFKELGNQLNENGMKRSQADPDLKIVMSFYSGQKEQYVPPQQIISTNIKNTWNWYWGSVPMPITSTTTIDGYTDVTYLTTISLKFLDAGEIDSSKLPPVVWSGSISQASKTKTAIVDKCSDIFALMLYQFPTVWYPNSEYYYLKNYSYTGIIYNKNDLQTITDVIPGSPAANAGIHKGDEILRINSIKIPDKYSDAGTKKWSYMAYSGKYSGLRYLFMPTGLVFKPYGNNVATLNFKIKRDGKRMKFSVKPEDKYVFLMFKN